MSTPKNVDAGSATGGASVAGQSPGCDEAFAQANRGLMFRWKDRRRRGPIFALMFFVGVALLIHAVGFYLFQVAQPVTGRVEAHTARVTMLDPADAATAALLREVDDRLVFLRPASLGTGSRLRIEDFSVTLEPSYLQGEVSFRPPPQAPLETRVLEELLPKGGLVLPSAARLWEDELAGEEIFGPPLPPGRGDASGEPARDETPISSGEGVPALER